MLVIRFSPRAIGYRLTLPGGQYRTLMPRGPSPVVLHLADVLAVDALAAHVAAGACTLPLSLPQSPHSLTTLRGRGLVPISSSS